MKTNRLPKNNHVRGYWWNNPMHHLTGRFYLTAPPLVPIEECIPWIGLEEIVNENQ
jgi:hypothetical protein